MKVNNFKNDNDKSYGFVSLMTWKKKKNGKCQLNLV